jgi:hypothetical protein
MNTNEVKKELYRSKANAKFSHYTAGNLYYTVEMSDGTYQFPIPVTEQVADLAKQAEDFAKWYVENNTGVLGPDDFVNIFKAGARVGTFKLSSDLGTTSFCAEVKGSDLNRWIAKAIEKDDFVKVS